jgi:hypothetical protein
MAYHISASSLSRAHIQPVHRKQIPFSVWATQQKSALCTAGSKKKGDRSEKKVDGKHYCSVSGCKNKVGYKLYSSLVNKHIRVVHDIGTMAETQNYARNENKSYSCTEPGCENVKSYQNKRMLSVFHT